jgi:hypothetical protein
VLLARKGAALAVIAFALAAVDARAQDLEPRAYVNTPVGINFLIAGYAYSERRLFSRSFAAGAGTPNFKSIP